MAQGGSHVIPGPGTAHEHVAGPGLQAVGYPVIVGRPGAGGGDGRRGRGGGEYLLIVTVGDTGGGKRAVPVRVGQAVADDLVRGVGGQSRRGGDVSAGG